MSETEVYYLIIGISERKNINFLILRTYIKKNKEAEDRLFGSIMFINTKKFLKVNLSAFKIN